VNMNNHMVQIKELVKGLQDGMESYLPVFPEESPLPIRDWR